MYRKVHGAEALVLVSEFQKGIVVTLLVLLCLNPFDFNDNFFYLLIDVSAAIKEGN